MWYISGFDVFSAFLFRCKVPVPKLDCIIYMHPQKQLQHIFHRKCWAVLECDGYAVKGLQQLTTNCCGF
jgi:hypothetical protein